MSSAHVARLYGSIFNIDKLCFFVDICIGSIVIWNIESRKFLGIFIIIEKNDHKTPLRNGNISQYYFWIWFIGVIQKVLLPRA